MRSPPRLILVVVAWLAGPVAQACPSCRPSVEAAVFGEDFLGVLAMLLSPLVVIALVGAVIYFYPRPGGSDEQ